MRVFTVMDEFDGKPLRSFSSKADAMRFANGRKVVASGNRTSRKQKYEQLLANVGEALM